MKKIAPYNTNWRRKPGNILNIIFTYIKIWLDKLYQENKERILKGQQNIVIVINILLKFLIEIKDKHSLKNCFESIDIFIVSDCEML